MAHSISIDRASYSSTKEAQPYHELDASSLITKLIPNEQQRPVLDPEDPARLGHNVTTAHMLQVQWDAETGWGTPRMEQYGKIALAPTASVLHYATETFEGMKVYRGYDGKLRLFRPELNCARLRQSNARVSLPSFDPEQLLKLIERFLAIECTRWLPHHGTSLYVRPAMIGSGPALGLQVPSEALFFMFTTQFPQASGDPLPGIKLLASSPEQIRAWPGGFGSAKVGASYGPALMAQTQAQQLGCSQTLWLFGKENLVTEAGASNFFIIWKRQDSDVLELVTSSLDLGVVLSGVTRRSILELVRERLPELQVVEREFSMDEVAQAYADGRLVEAFVSGTALFVLPVSMIKYGDIDVKLPMTTEKGFKTPVSKYSSTLRSWLVDIMYGREDHPWGYVIDELQP